MVVRVIKIFEKMNNKSFQNSFCKKCSEHLRDCSKMKEPFFRIYPFLYENKKELREFKEKRFIMRWKPQLNTYQ